MNFFWLIFISENGVAPQGVFNHLGNFGNHLAPPLENPPKPEFLRDGVIENMVDINFEGGSYNPYRFVPTVHMGQNQASFHVVGDNTNRYAVWNAMKLDQTIERDNPDAPPDISRFTSGQYTTVKNGWQRGYCLQMKVIPLSESAKMTVTYKWFRLAKDELIKDELKAEIYTKSECESNAKWPFKIEGNKRKCIPLKTPEGNPAETVVKIWRQKAGGAKFQLQFDIYPGSQFALDDIKFEDCSKDPSESNAPAKEVLPNWLPDTLKSGKYGTYWSATEDNMKKVQKPKKAPSTPRPPVNTPRASGPRILHRGPMERMLRGNPSPVQHSSPVHPNQQNQQNHQHRPVQNNQPQIQPAWQKPEIAKPSLTPTVSKHIQDHQNNQWSQQTPHSTSRSTAWSTTPKITPTQSTRSLPTPPQWHVETTEINLNKFVRNTDAQPTATPNPTVPGELVEEATESVRQKN